MGVSKRVLERKYRQFKRKYLGEPLRDYNEFPCVIQIDTNNYCGPEHCKGQYCTYCYPQWMIVRGKRRFVEMPMEWIEWIFREIKRDGAHMSYVDTFLNGDAQKEERNHEIWKKSKRLNSWLRTQTFTCGVLPEKVDLILDKNLDSLCFTISAHTPSLYRKVHRADHFYDALKTLGTVLDRRHKGLNVEVHCVLTKDNIGYASEWWDYFGVNFPEVRRVLSPLVATSDNLPSRAALGYLTLDVQEDVIMKVAGAEGKMWTRALIPHRKPCVLWDNMSIDCEGYILQCCNWCDPLKWNYGTIQELIDDGRSLKSVWMERLSNLMRNRVCRSCNMKHRDWMDRLPKIAAR